MLAYVKAREEDKDYQLVDTGPDDDVAAAYVVAEIVFFFHVSNYVRLVLGYYDVLKVVEEYRKDLTWIERDWSSFGNLEHPFLEKITLSPSLLSREVAQLYRTSSLSRVLNVPSGLSGRCLTSTFREMVGRLARHKQLNDIALDMALWNVATYSTRCYAVDAFSATDENMFIPDNPLSNCKFVLVPVHMLALKH
ncbi:hypothetical protein V7S43_014369 [Phytophthora oleae]|uniref:Uncharacterized protein n=1 Tax=Phytophthora oleae TaxID=2107226 RepID=A0ABD3F6B1_9STRA